MADVYAVKRVRKPVTPDLETVSLADVRKKKAAADGASGPAGERRDDSPEGGVIRNRPGAADPATVKRMLDKRLAEREPVTVKSTTVVKKQQPKAALPAIGPAETLNENKHRTRAMADRY